MNYFVKRVLDNPVGEAVSPVTGDHYIIGPKVNTHEGPIYHQTYVKLTPERKAYMERNDGQRENLQNCL